MHANTSTTAGSITLAGTPYQLRRMNLGQICDIEEAVSAKGNGSAVRMALDVTKIAMRRDHADVVLDDDVELGADELRDAMKTILQIAGFMPADETLAGG